MRAVDSVRSERIATSDAIGRKSLTGSIPLPGSHAVTVALAPVMARCYVLPAALLLPIALGFLLPFIFINFIQDQFANGAFMRHLIEKFELVGITIYPFVNFLIDAGILPLLYWRIGRGRRRGGRCGWRKFGSLFRGCF
ncbi:MAG: hypothetical protein ACREDS_09860 [Limisphaerales bacterium]